VFCGQGHATDLAWLVFRGMSIFWTTLHEGLRVDLVDIFKNVYIDMLYTSMPFHINDILTRSDAKGKLNSSKHVFCLFLRPQPSKTWRWLDHVITFVRQTKSH